MENLQLLELGKNAIDIEIKELKRLQARLDKSFLQALKIINECQGKLIIVGIGKSAHIATKIVATLNSTGTPSQFLHASEAFHGDLGLIQKHDVVLCISNSGNSSEIVSVLPYLKKYSASLIGMTGNPNSKLAEIAEVILDSYVETEACPNRLAPTSSTTVQMVLGDALAVCLMEMKNFKEQDFAKFHPGGNLGKNLTATVEQFLSQNMPSVPSDAKIRDIIISISSSKHGITVVLDKGIILGVITDGDLRRMLLENESLQLLIAEDIMSKNPKTIEKNALAKDAMQILKDYNIGQLIVTAEGKYAGIIDIHKLLDEGIN